MTENTITSDPVTVREVSKSFGETQALDAVTLTVRPGEAVGLLGPNGAGKSTLISLLTGLRRPDQGQVRVFGADPLDPAARLRIGITPQATSVPPNLRVGEVIDLVGAHFGTTERGPALLADFGLTDLIGKQCGGLSGGQQRRLLVALALVGNPELLILDEPTTGLDIEARERLWSAIRGYRSTGGTLLITSHYLAEIEALAGRVVVIDRGRVIGDGSVAEITSAASLRRVGIRTDAAEAALRGLPGVLELSREDDRVTLATKDADALVRTLVRDEVPFTDLTVAGASLEEAFLALTGRTEAAPPAGAATARLSANAA